MAEVGLNKISINLSVVQLMNHNLVRSFENILTEYEVEPANIFLEVTESTTTSNIKALLSTMEALDGLGFTFSLDDYGTGYSTVTQILNMPFKVIKLDKSLLWSAVDSKNTMVFLSNTIKIYLFAKPMPITDLIHWLNKTEHFACPSSKGSIL